MFDGDSGFTLSDTNKTSDTNRTVDYNQFQIPSGKFQPDYTSYFSNFSNPYLRGLGRIAGAGYSAYSNIKDIVNAQQGGSLPRAQTGNVEEHHKYLDEDRENINIQVEVKIFMIQKRVKDAETGKRSWEEVNLKKEARDLYKQFKSSAKSETRRTKLAHKYGDEIWKVIKNMFQMRNFWNRWHT